MQRFFVEPYQVQEEEHRITLTGPDLNHMKNVLRMRIGEDVWISDGSEKEYHCTIEEFLGERVRLHRRVHAAHAAHDKALKGGFVEIGRASCRERV